MKKIKVLAVCGSLRGGSFNRMLLRIAVKFASEAGAEVSELDLAKLGLPVYNKDIEEAGLPAPVKELKAAVETCDVLLIASPEYNHSIPGGLKNAIDWASRSGNSFNGKFAAVFGASDGPIGTARMQPQLRQALACVNVAMLPQPQVFVRFAAEAFSGDGSLKDAKTAETLKKLVVDTLAKI
jgi:chromate reductase, NAD(P)H dehydrogenase (quinone)